MANLALSVLCCAPPAASLAPGASAADLEAGGYLCRTGPGSTGDHGNSSGAAHCLLCPAHLSPAVAIAPDAGPAEAAPVTVMLAAAQPDARSRAYWVLILGISSRGPPSVT